MSSLSWMLPTLEEDTDRPYCQLEDSYMFLLLQKNKYLPLIVLEKVQGCLTSRELSLKPGNL